MGRFCPVSSAFSSSRITGAIRRQPLAVGGKNGYNSGFEFEGIWAPVAPDSLDGPIVVNGILTIPLSGHRSGPADPPDALRRGLREFVIGPENLLAANVLRSCLDAKAAPDSPLVIYGPHGCGKSHLAHGLVGWWHEHFPLARAEYLTASEFAQGFAAALETQQFDAWRRGIRENELLVIDDLEQLAAKRPAQQELLQSLDAMEDRQALVVVTAHALPSCNQSLLPALRSRLSAGLSVPLALPGPAARRAILERVAADRRLTIPRRALDELADGLKESVPSLIAAVLELELGAQVANHRIGTRLVRQYMQERSKARMPSLRDIATAVARHFELKVADLKSPLRRQPLVVGRGVAMYLARELTDASLQQIGRFFGGRDHTTVINALDRTEGNLRRDPLTRQAIAELKQQLVAT
jgi:chromosomal replication initiator protein